MKIADSKCVVVMNMNIDLEFLLFVVKSTVMQLEIYE